MSWTWFQVQDLHLYPAYPPNLLRHARQVVVDLAFEIMGRDIAFVALEERVDVGTDGLEVAGVARAMHGEEFGVQMIDAITFEHQASTADVRQCAVDQQRDFFRGDHQA